MSTDGDLVREGAPAIRINVRPLGNPLPLGMFSFGIGMLLLAAQSAAWVPNGGDMQVGLILAAFVFPLEAVATVIAYLARDTCQGPYWACSPRPGWPWDWC